MRKFWHLGSFGVQAGNMGRETRRRKNRKLMARPFILLSLASFPNLPATIFQSSKSAPYILPSAFGCIQWETGWNADSITTGTVTSISVHFSMSILERREILREGGSHINLALDFLTGHYKAVTSTSHSCTSTYVNYGLLLSQKIQFSVKTK